MCDSYCESRFLGVDPPDVVLDAYTSLGALPLAMKTNPGALKVHSYIILYAPDLSCYC